MEFVILAVRRLRNDNWMVDAVNAYGRRTGAVVAWWQTTAEGIQAALERSYALQLEAVRDREGALASMAADQLDPPDP